MTADLDPALVEKVAEVFRRHFPADGLFSEHVARAVLSRAVLSAVADWMNDCDSEALRRNAMHERLVREARIEGAKEILAEVETLHSQDESILAAGKWCPACGDETPCRTVLAARKAFTRIEKERKR